MRRVYHICVANSLARELPRCLLCPPSQTIPDTCINVELAATLLFRRDANHFSNAAGSRIFANLELDVRDRVYCILCPDKYCTQSIGEGEDEEHEEEGKEEENSSEQEESSEEEEEYNRKEEENEEEEEEGGILSG